MNLSPLLAAGRLAADPRIAQGKELFCEAVAEQQRLFTGIRPALPELKQSYDQILATFTEWRAAPLWFPFLGSGFGKGALVELLDGSVKYDFISGLGAHYFGHSHLKLLESGLEAALSDVVIQGNLEQNGDTVALCEVLIRASNLDHILLTTSGAMANENALKIAFHKKPATCRILAFERCFVGRTLALSQISDKPSYREGLPATIQVDYIPYFDPHNPEKSQEAAIQALEKYLMRYPKQHAAMIFELIQGEAGFYAGTTDFFKALMTILKAHNITIIDDEVQCFGRLPELFAYQYFKLEEFIDIVTIGKLAQVCATLFRKDLKPKPGLLSQTFTSSTAAIRASYVILKQLLDDHYYGPDGKIVRIHNYFVMRLKAIAERHPKLLAGPFGLGGMIAFTPLQGHAPQVMRFVQALFEAGIIGFIAGSHPTRCRFLVPIGAVSEEDISQVTEIVEQVLLRS